MSTEKMKIVLTAGGSGGHVFPAKALCEELTKRGIEVSFITDFRGDAFSQKIQASKEYCVFSGAFSGKPFHKKLWALFLMFLGLIQSYLILRDLKPKAVVGFGGYASIPACYAAILLKIPLILHEQNTVLGGANRALAKKSSLIATTFPVVERLPKNLKAIYTGVPVRPEIMALQDFPYQAPSQDADAAFNLLVFGGSQGARIFSTIIPEALKSLPEKIKQRIKVVQQARPEDVDALKKEYEEANITAEVASFFTDIAERFKTAHLVLCRSGASSITELCISGRPSILVPMLHSPDSHQLKNALFLSSNEGAILFEEDYFTKEALNKQIQSFLLNPKVLLQTAEKAKKLSKPNALSCFADAVLETIEESEKIALQTAEELQNQEQTDKDKKKKTKRKGFMKK